MDYSRFIGKSFKPHPALSKYIRQYNLNITSNTNSNNLKIKSIPFSLAGIVLLFDNTDMSLVSSKSGLNKLQKACLIGYNPIHYDNYLIINGFSLRGVTISLTFLGINILLQIPLKLLHNQFIDLELILGDKVILLIEQLQESDSEQQMVAILDSFFLHLLNIDKKIHQPFLSKLNHILSSNHRIVKVNELANQSHMHERSLQRMFKEEVGLTPKEFLRLMRFIRIINLISLNPRIHVQDLVWQGGFFDQAHFIHEFQTITNYTPKEFYRNLGLSSKKHLIT
jgi:AraC-like DNA-binding protein